MNYSAVSQDAGPGKKLLRHAGFRAAAAVAAGSLLLASAGVVYADDIYNTAEEEISIDSDAEVMPLNVGVNGTTKLQIQPKKDDGENGCNVKNDYSVTLNLFSSDPSVATVSPSSVLILDCEAPGVSLTIAPLKTGSTTITASVATNNSPGTFNLAPATFTVNVTAPVPSNAAPVLSITGVENGGSYTKGSVPAAVCSVTDTEDGPSSFDAALGPITGPDSATGVGSQEASCAYTDDGGLTASSSVTYRIADGSAPEVSYTLSPATPNGYDGWYRSEVYLDWTVTESDSPSTLSTVGCTDQLISLDQLPADYGCSATSSGGSAVPVTVSIKKDGIAPTVRYTSATGTQGNDDWYTSDVLALFTATDGTSGPASATGTVGSTGEGSAVAVLSPAFQDNAGNTTAAGAASHSFKIDKTAPKVSYTIAAGTEGTNGWYTSDVVATFTGTDDTSGPLTATKTATSVGEGESVVVQSPAFEDVAGNLTPAGADSRSFKIDKSDPTASFDSTVGNAYFGSVGAAPTCTASDDVSGPAGCVVTGYSTRVGTHTLTATATDNAGRTATAEQRYTVLAWTINGFYQPVDMNGVLNTVKGGSTVPVKFEVFAGTRELTDPGLVSFAAAKIQCTLEFMDDVEVTATGNTSLRYDATAGQFVYNWKTPTGAGTCYRLTMTAADGSFITANFKLK
jgi:hypothetical protein